MKEILKKYKYAFIASALFIIFVIYTILVKNVDVRPTGLYSHNDGSEAYVGFSHLNFFVKSKQGEHLALYNITDWASVITIPFGFVFFITGIVQWKKRKNILRVDPNILALGVFYVLDFASYLFFQYVVINYRPVYIYYHKQDLNVLESSYPSSTTVLSITVILSAIDQANIYIKNHNKLRIGINISCIVLTVFLVVGRIISGVHWISDIIGGTILAITLDVAYLAIKQLFIKVFQKKRDELKSE